MIPVHSRGTNTLLAVSEFNICLNLGDELNISPICLSRLSSHTFKASSYDTSKKLSASVKEHGTSVLASSSDSSCSPLDHSTTCHGTKSFESLILVSISKNVSLKYCTMSIKPMIKSIPGMFHTTMFNFAACALLLSVVTSISASSSSLLSFIVC